MVWLASRSPRSSRRPYADIKPRAVRLPKNVDLRPSTSKVEDQKQIGSCTANALVGALEFLEIKSGGPPTDLSRLFVYYNERVIEGTVGSDSGAYIRDGIKTLVAQGVCPEKSWPYIATPADPATGIFPPGAPPAQKPSAACYAAALAHRVSSYSRIDTTLEMRTCLASGYPFVFGFTVYESFESPAVAKTGVLDLPGPKEKNVGGHSVLAVGYDDATERFLVRNSWGSDWGQKGHFTIPYAYLANRNLAADFWTIRGSV